MRVPENREAQLKYLQEYNDNDGVADIEFEWDEAKNAANRKKTRRKFRGGSRIFRDPFYVSMKERIVDGEERWQTFGTVAGLLLLMAAHTVREEQSDGKTIEVIRIISARCATPKERRRYEDENSSLYA